MRASTRADVWVCQQVMKRKMEVLTAHFPTLSLAPVKKEKVDAGCTMLCYSPSKVDPWRPIRPKWPTQPEAEVALGPLLLRWHRVPSHRFPSKRNLSAMSPLPSLRSTLYQSRRCTFLYSVSPHTTGSYALNARAQRYIRVSRHYQVHDARYVPDHDRRRNCIMEEKGGREFYIW